MLTKKYLSLMLLVLAVFCFLSVTSPQAASLKINNGIAITGQEEDFKPIWIKYRAALNAAYDALKTDDYSTAKNQIEKLKEAANDVQKSDIPQPIRKSVKKALKYTKKLIKAYRNHDREDIKVNIGHIKDAIAQIEKSRGNRGED